MRTSLPHHSSGSSVTRGISWAAVGAEAAMAMLNFFQEAVAVRVGLAWYETH
jgi:hypothetical protein